MDRHGQGEMGIGSGIVADSQGSKEYAECLLKMKFLIDPVQRFDLIETLLYEHGQGFWLLPYHLKRLSASAAYFGFIYDEGHVRKALNEAVKVPNGQRLRVRLLLDEDGKITVTATPLASKTSENPMRYVISDTRLSPSDLFLFHKTTRRELYDKEWKHFSDTLGSDEVIYLNTRGELTEGSRTSIFVERGGTLLTPPTTAGLLPGTLRASLIDEGRAVECVLRPEDLADADAVFLGNSVRGLTRAVPLIPV